jgi:hypothetical protein
VKLLSAFLAAFFLFVALPALAQSPDTPSSSPSAVKPADSQTNAKAATSPEKKKPKKVWTNDELGGVKGDISVVGDGNAYSGAPTSAKSAPSAGPTNAHQRLVDSYRDQIQQYQAQIDAIDKRIAQLKDFKAENTSPSGGINPYQGYDMVPLSDQMKQLEDRKKQLQSRIDDTEVEARKHGVDPGELR